MLNATRTRGTHGVAEGHVPLKETPRPYELRRDGRDIDNLGDGQTPQELGVRRKKPNEQGR